MPDITAHVEGKLADFNGGLPGFPIQISYSTNEPYTLRFDFHIDEEEPVTWLLSLELFEQAFGHCNMPVGTDTLVMFCHPGDDGSDEICLYLSSNEGTATIIIPAEGVRDVIEEALELKTDNATEQALNALIQEVETYLAGH